MLELYQQISLNRDFSEHNLRRGDIATLVDIVPHPDNSEDGYVLEVFNAVGESIQVLIVPISAIEPLTPNEILSVRSLA